MILNLLKSALKLPIVRHIIAGLLIVVVVASIYRGEIRRQGKQIKQLTETVKQLAEQPKYSIENKISGIKKDNNITLIPDNDLNVVNPETNRKLPDKKKGFFKRLFSKKK